MQGRGIAIGYGASLELPRMFSNERRVVETCPSAIGEIADSPLSFACSVVSRLVATLRPDIATKSALDTQLRIWAGLDRRRDRRRLGFLDALLARNDQS
jgi:hypothetical protein